MARLRLSLARPPPPGFALREAPLAAREVRRQVFALAADTPEEAEAALARFRPGDLCGLVVTCGPELAWTRRPGGLHHLAVPATLWPSLPALVDGVLGLLEEQRALKEQAELARVQLGRSEEDRLRAAEASAHTQEGLFREIRERRAAAEALRRSEERFRAIFNSVNDSILIHEAQTGAILEVNQRACELYGWPREELVGLPGVGPLSSGQDGYDGARAAALMRSAGSEPQTFLWEARHRSGRPFWVEVGMRRAELDGEPRVLVTVRDVTERRAQEEARQKLELRMQQAQKLESLGALASGIAHDFNNILTAIAGNAGLALDGLPPGADGRRELENITEAARCATDLCRQMLAFAGKGRMVASRVDLNSVVQGIAKMLQVSVFQSASLELSLAPGLPAVEADGSQVGQVVMNLVINAAEAVRAQGAVRVRTGAVRCSAEDLEHALGGAAPKEGDYVYVEVADDGQGMSRETLERIFDPFFTTKPAGRGLGLAAVLGIVRRHGGAVKVASEVGKGTTFRVLLPAAAPAPPGA